MIEHIGWAVPPKFSGVSRATKLVAELQALDVVGLDCKFTHHGSASSSLDSTAAGRLYPKLRVRSGVRSAVLSPVFPNIDFESSDLAWFDAYDDWSLAPDINGLHRLHAARTYRSARGRKDAGLVVTVNSEYMAAKLQLPRDSVVANGVDVILAKIPRTGDDKIRVIMLGHFFEGRTDFDLIAEVARIEGIDEIVVAGLGSSSKSQARIRSILKPIGPRFVEIPWLDSMAIGRLAGRNTVAVVPHIVSDYTISQNLMKAFQFVSLGIPVVCPLLLWPREIDIDLGYMVGFGSRLSETLVPWIRSVDIPDATYRAEFVKRNSWGARAEDIAERIFHGL